MKSRSIALVLLLGLILQLEEARSGSSGRPVLIVVSYDAFRTEYLLRNSTAYMNELRRNGTTANYLRNVFPTKTFPNHHSIATGVYPNVHGVMGNGLYDHQQGALNYSYELFHYNPELIPIWTLNEQQGGVSGCMMWPGSDMPYGQRNISCSYMQRFNRSVPWDDRVTTMFRWIRDPNRPANLVMFYIEEPDFDGHIYSPESDRVRQLVEQLDELTRSIRQKIDEYQLQGRVNVVHLSDHGMDSLMPKNFINLTDYVPVDVKYEAYGSTPVLQIVPKVKQQTADLFRALKNASDRDGRFDVYNVENLPPRWHYNNSRRTGPITAVAKLGFGFDDMWKTAEYYQKKYGVEIKPDTRYGAHGYDNELPIMRPIFFAYGPMIREHQLVEPFDTVDLFYLFCSVLNLPPPYYLAGNRNHVATVLRNDSRDDNDDHGSSETGRTEKLAVIFAVSLLVSFLLVSLLAAVVIYQQRRRENQVPPYLYEETETFMDEGNKLLHSNTTNSSINGDVVSVEV